MPRPATAPASSSLSGRYPILPLCFGRTVRTEPRVRPGAMSFAMPNRLSPFTMLPAVFVSSRDPDGDFESRS
jgi:hypothetical protein